MEVKKIVEGMTAPQVAQVIDDNFKAQNKILEEDIVTQNSVIGVSEYKDFSEAEAVNVGDVRKYNGFLYECVEATTGAFDASKWKKSSFKAETEKKLSELGSYLQCVYIEGLGVISPSSMKISRGLIPGKSYKINVLNPNWDMGGLVFDAAKFAIHLYKDNVRQSAIVVVNNNDGLINPYYIIHIPEDYDGCIEFATRANKGEVCLFTIEEWVNDVTNSIISSMIRNADISNFGELFQTGYIDRTTKNFASHSDYRIYKIDNNHYKNIKCKLYHNWDGALSVAFYSDFNISADSYIDGVISENTKFKDWYIADVPTNCKLIVICHRFKQSVLDGEPVYFESPEAYLFKNSSELEEKRIVLSDFIFNKESFKYGYLNDDNTERVELHYRTDIYSTDYYNIQGFNLISVENNQGNYNIMFYWYDADYNMIKRNWYPTNPPTIVTIPENACYCRVSFRRLLEDGGVSTLDFDGVSLMKVNTDSLTYPTFDSINDKFLIKHENTFDGNLGGSGVGFSRDVNTSTRTTNGYIEIRDNCIYKINSEHLTSVFFYDADKAFISFSSWYTKENKLIPPFGAKFIKIGFRNPTNGYLNSSDNFGITTIDVIEYKDNDRFLLTLGQKYLPAHLFTDNEKGNDVLIPWQSVYDIDITHRLGFKCMELNTHRTSDGVFICIHGSNGKFGSQVEHVDGVTDVSSMVIAETSYEYIKTNIRYKAIYDKYKLPITKLSEACKHLRLYNMTCVLAASFDPAYFSDAEDIIKSNLGKPFGVGVYSYTRFKQVRQLFNGTILLFDNSSKTIEEIVDVCKKMNQNYIHVWGDLINYFNNKDYDTISQYVSVVKSLNGYSGFTTAYYSAALSQKIDELGVDFLGSGREVPYFEDGNIVNLDSGIDFSDFNHSGVVENTVLKLSQGKGLYSDSHGKKEFLSKGYLVIRYKGTLKISMGKLIYNVIDSNGDVDIELSTYYMNEIPSFAISAESDCEIFKLIYKASKS